MTPNKLNAVITIIRILNGVLKFLLRLNTSNKRKLSKMHEIAVKIKYEPIRFKMNLLTGDFMLPLRKFQLNNISISNLINLNKHLKH